MQIRNEKLRKVCEKVEHITLVTIPLTLMSAMTAFAGDAAADSTGGGSSGSGPADFLNGTGVSGTGKNAFDKLNTTTKAAGSSLFGTATTVVLLVAGVALLVSAARLTGNSKSRDEAKTRILWIAGALLLVGGAVGLINLFTGIGKDAFG